MTGEKMSKNQRQKLRMRQKWEREQKEEELKMQEAKEQREKEWMAKEQKLRQQLLQERRAKEQLAKQQMAKEEQAKEEKAKEEMVKKEKAREERAKEEQANERKEAFLQKSEGVRAALVELRNKYTAQLERFDTTRAAIIDELSRKPISHLDDFILAKIFTLKDGFDSSTARTNDVQHSVVQMYDNLLATWLRSSRYGEEMEICNEGEKQDEGSDHSSEDHGDQKAKNGSANEDSGAADDASEDSNDEDDTSEDSNN